MKSFSRQGTSGIKDERKLAEDSDVQSATHDHQLLQKESLDQSDSISWRYYPWIAMLLSPIVWLPLSGSTGNSLGNTGNVYRIFLVVSAGVLAPILLLRNIRQLGSACLSPYILLFLYGLIAFLSSMLVPANAFYTMWKALEIIVDIVAIMGIIVGSKSPVAAVITAYRLVMWVNGLILLFVVLGALISPSEGFQGSRGIIPFQLQGYFPIVNANGVGFISALLFIHNIGVLSRTTRYGMKMTSILMVCVSCITLILAQSRTSIAAVILALPLYLYLDKKHRSAFILFTFAGVALLFTSASEFVRTYLERGQSTELMTSLSGRTKGWEIAWEMFLQSPYFGHGFAAAARTEILGVKAGAASTLHGALFDVIVGVGFVGLVPWLMAIGLTMVSLFSLSLGLKKYSITRIERSMHAEFCAVANILFIRALTSSGLAMHDIVLMILLCLAGYAYSMKRNLNERIPLTNGKLLE